MLVRLGAFYIDAVLDDAVATRVQVINRDPEGLETGVLTSSEIRFTIIDTGATGLAALSRVLIMTPLGTGGPPVIVEVFNQATGGVFEATYAAGSTFAASMSPGSAVVDQHTFVLVRATPWLSQSVVRILLEATTLAPAPVVGSFDYSFTIQDLTRPILTRATTRGLRTARLQFSEPMLRSGGVAGDATRMRTLSGGTDFTAPDTIRVPGAGFTTVLDLNSYVGVLGATDPRNDGYRQVLAVLDSERLQLSTSLGLLDTNVTEINSPATVSISPYALEGVSDATRTNPFFLPVVASISAPPQVEVSLFEDAQLLIDLGFSGELSPAAAYRVTAANAADIVGNLVTAAPAAFTSEGVFAPAARRFNLYEMLPALNRREDVSQDLLRFMRVLQDVTDVGLMGTDKFGELFDVDLAPVAALDTLLWQLGDPFSFSRSLGATDKRRVIDVLAEMYKRNGLEVGIEDVLAFFFGVFMDLIPFSSTEGLLLDVDALDTVGSELGLDSQFRLYAFDVVSPTPLTVTQRRRLVEIVEYAKPAHTHFFRLIEPPGALGAPVITFITDESLMDSVAGLG